MNGLAGNIQMSHLFRTDTLKNVTHTISKSFFGNTFEIAQTFPSVARFVQNAQLLPLRSACISKMSCVTHFPDSLVKLQKKKVERNFFAAAPRREIPNEDQIMN